MKNIRNKIFAFTLIITILCTVVTPAAVFAADTVTAVKSLIRILIDGRETVFDAYNIKGNNYIKLRDIAYSVSKTKKQFEVTWDASKNAINLLAGKPYTPVKGEMAVADDNGEGYQTAILSVSDIYLDGIEIKVTAYLIKGNNYFKLRDLGEVFDFFIGWDNASKTITIDTTKKYVPDESSVYNKIMAMQEKYPTGTPWTGEKYYAWKGGILKGGYGCLAFAFMLSDAAFGDLPARQHKDFTNMKVGDILRMNTSFGEHSVVVLIINDKGITITEGNYNEAVLWGREFTWEEIKKIGIHVTTRYPE